MKIIVKCLFADMKELLFLKQNFLIILVKNVFVPSLTTKKFVDCLSDSFKSKGSPVVSGTPAEVTDTEVAPIVTPRPICFAFVPPLPVALPPVAEDVV